MAVCDLALEKSRGRVISVTSQSEWDSPTKSPGREWQLGVEQSGSITGSSGSIHPLSTRETDETTFEQFADEWLENRESTKGSTWQNCQTHLCLHMKPVLG